jgi:selT/selW/selH-like putative selenoprotein
LASRLLTKFKHKIAVLELEPSKGGCFELDVNGKNIYSKLAVGKFPSEDAIIAEIEKLAT